VRVHTNAKAATSALAVNALAYTAGKNIVFANGQYAPETSRGARLLAHELTHVMQQGHLPGPVLPSVIGKADDPAEMEAAQLASRVEVPGPARLADSGPLSASTVRLDRSAALRRAVSVPDTGSELKIVAEHTTDLKVENLFGKWRARPFTPNPIKFAAKATAGCGPGDSAGEYEVGIVQVETREVNNGRYQGAVPADGSVWVRPDLPSVRPAGPCIDSAFQQFWHLKHPDGSLQTLRWVRWNEGWDYNFDTPVSGQSTITKGVGTHGNVQFAVPMAAPPELPTRYAVPAKNCNSIGYDAGDNPARIQASATW
jgi:hypothetical protein